MAALRHLRGLLGGNVKTHPSHNPAGAMMAYALWACLGVIILTGLGMSGLSPLKQAEMEAAVAAGDWSVVVKEEGQEPFFGEILEEVHEVAANLILFLAVLHVAGVVIEQRVMRRNLIAPMLYTSKGKRP
jgi:cytochrome b